MKSVTTAFLLAACALAQSGDEENVRAIVQTFADARNAHVGVKVASLYSADGEWIAARANYRVRGRAALVDLWKDLPGQVRRTVRSVDFPANSIAVVRVDVQYEQPLGLHHEVFVMVKDLLQWRIRVHQTAD